MAKLPFIACTAAALAALAATGAAAQSKLIMVSSFKNTGNVAGNKEEIEVLSYSFGSSQSGRVSKVDSFTIKQGVKPAPAPGGVQVAVGDVTGDAATVGGSQSMTVGSGQTESGQATGKRQHLPMRSRSYYDQNASPPAKGTVWVRVSSPWTACRVGTRYPSIELNTGAKRHVLQDVVVSSCGGSSAQGDRPTEEVAFYYNKIAFTYAH